MHPGTTDLKCGAPGFNQGVGAGLGRASRPGEQVVDVELKQRTHEALIERLATAGFIAPDAEAAELVARAGGDRGRLDALVQRRLTGEPLAWITGSVSFCGLS